MQSFLRFVNRLQQSFLLPSALQTLLRQPSGRPRNPCQCCLAAPRCVARGRIVSERGGVGKGYLKYFFVPPSAAP
ncbi:hypothetical protein CBM2604_B50127 [Cupriavidus taiwanensis]|nr:hypothetical protein CBM2604_B50127 [Cupriavidus taiwanensis]SOZ48367.1 hypothetical protein CBM2610_B40127 [Cupriavidus taiwanensis]